MMIDNIVHYVSLFLRAPTLKNIIKILSMSWCIQTGIPKVNFDIGIQNGFIIADSNIRVMRL